MKFSTLFVILSVCFISKYTNADSIEASITVAESGDLKGKLNYEFIPQSKGLYKFYKTPKKFNDAKTICEDDGAILYYPETETESNAVLLFLKNKRSESFPSQLLLGLVRNSQVFETIDGISLDNAYTNWHQGEPNNPTTEHCVVFLTEHLTMNNVPCSLEYPFICKSRTNVWNEQCLVLSSDYGYSEELGKCYKLHLYPKTWADAQEKCREEQSQLAVINSHEEAAYLVRLTQRTLRSIPGRFAHGVVLLGFHNNKVEDWQTVDGTSLYYSGYACWGNSQPDGGERDRCGSMFYNGHLNDINCAHKAFFICESDNVAVDYVREPRSFFTVIQSVRCHDII